MQQEGRTWAVLQPMEENTETLVGNNNRPSKAREKEEK